jgi:hypothetical protein
LVNSAGGEVARGATSPSVVLTAGEAGRYHVMMRQIGQQPWRSAAFALAAGAAYPVTFRIETRPYELATLTVEARRACDSSDGWRREAELLSESRPARRRRG